MPRSGRRKTGVLHLLPEAVSQLGVDDLVEAFAHVPNKRRAGVIEVEQGPAKVAALQCGLDVEAHVGVRAPFPDGTPRDQVRLLGLDDLRCGLVVQERQPLACGDSIRAA